MSRALLLLVLAVTLAASTSDGRDWLVKPDGTGDAPTLAAAAESAAAYDVILLADGTFRGPGNRDVVVKEPLVFRSVSQSARSCVIDCERLGRAFSLEASAVFYDLTITRGDVSGFPFLEGYGGAIYAAPTDDYGGTPTFEIYGCTFVDNAARVGGAIATWGWFLEDRGGPRGRSIIANSVFVENRAVRSGAFYVEYVWGPEVRGCQFFRNVAARDGGVLDLPAHTDTIFEDCLFVGNEASRGGAIVADGYADLYRCTLVANRGHGGAHVYRPSSFYGELILDHCILVFGKGGPAIDCGSREFEWAGCTDIYGNEGGDWIDCFQGWDDLNDNISADPLFCPGDYTLSEGSPCSAQESSCGRMGALPVGCGAVAVQPLSWSRIKSAYR